MGLLLASVIGSQFAAAQTQPAKTLAPTPTPTPPIEEQEGVIKVDTEAVNVLLTAQDKNRKLLLTLKPADLQIFENGQPQEISSFARHVDLPLSLAILIDTSMSQERTLPEEKMAAMSFLESVVRPEKDEVSIISFTGESTLEQGMTSNMSRLRRAIEGVRLSPQMGYIGGGVVVGTPPISGNSASGATAVWDAIWITSEEILGPAPEKTRRAIILLSDGVNTYGKKKLNEAVEAAQKAEAVIYAIGIGDNFTNGVDRGSLDKVAERTGGRAYFPRDEADLRKAFQQIQEEMRSQYMVSYEPTNPALDGSYRTIEIKLLNPDLQKQKIQLTHRKGYFAKTQKRK
jgi:VWFA-related protein